MQERNDQNASIETINLDKDPSPYNRSQTDQGKYGAQEEFKDHFPEDIMKFKTEVRSSPMVDKYSKQITKKSTSRSKRLLRQKSERLAETGKRILRGSLDNLTILMNKILYHMIKVIKEKSLLIFIGN